MNHSHSTEYSNSAATKAGIRVTWVGAAVNVFLIVLKLWVGYAAKSQALIADGFHSVSDLFSDAAVILGLKWGRKAADENHPYGHARIETFTGLIISILLIAVAVWIGYRAIASIYFHYESQPTLVTIAAAFISIVLKEAMYWYTITISRRIKSIALAGNAWHHRTDAMSSVAVLIGVVAAYINPNWHLADSIAALVVTIFILRVAVSLGVAAFREVVDTAPPMEIIDDLAHRAASVEGVKNVHDIKARNYGQEIFVELHLAVDPDISVKKGHEIARSVQKLLIRDINEVTRVIIHVDPEGDEAD